MIKYPFLLALLALCLSLYSCKKDKDTTILDSSDVYLTKWVFNATVDNPQIWIMTYDNQNRLSGITEDGDTNKFIYNSDGTLSRVQIGSEYSEEYHYLEGVLKYSTLYDLTTHQYLTDVIPYEMGSNGLVHRSTLPSLGQVDIYTYYGNNLLKMFVRQQMDGSQILSSDTTLYEWSAQGNLVKETRIESTYTKVKTYTYDDKPNYFGSLHFPWNYPIRSYNFEVYKLSANNCMQIIVEVYGQTFTHNFNILGYNSWGYPTKISDEYDNVMEFTYEKY